MGLTKKTSISFKVKPGWVSFILLALGSLIIVMPLLWMLSTSLKSMTGVYKFPPGLIPRPIMWQNYIDAWNSANFPRYFLNSTIVAVVVTLGELTTSSLAAFAFARMKFRGSNLLFLMVLGTLMIPKEILLIPNYVILKQLDWLNSYLALTVPFMAGAFGIFILRQHFLTIHQDLEDAAIMDGCSRLRFLLSIVIPNSKPALAAVAVFSFITNWNSYIWPLIVTRDDSLRTIQVGLSAFKDAETSGANTNWALLMAASVTTLVPVIIIYAFAQEWFTEGYITSGIRG
jgi:multiple sugar transport system permease protein